MLPIATTYSFLSHFLSATFVFSLRLAFFPPYFWLFLCVCVYLFKCTDCTQIFILKSFHIRVIIMKNECIPKIPKYGYAIWYQAGTCVHNIIYRLGAAWKRHNKDGEICVLAIACSLGYFFFFSNAFLLFHLHLYQFSVWFFASFCVIHNVWFTRKEYF